MDLIHTRHYPSITVYRNATIKYYDASEYYDQSGYPLKVLHQQPSQVQMKMSRTPGEINDLTETLIRLSLKFRQISRDPK